MFKQANIISTNNIFLNSHLARLVKFGIRILVMASVLLPWMDIFVGLVKIWLDKLNLGSTSPTGQVDKFS